ncbi:MAG: hypothetical protein VX899_08110 [Myxococcota bacterium]|nr:hypothetical protein [Myxococcota bacterium]
MSPELRARLPLALSAFGLVGTASYTLQRLYDAATETDSGLILATATIPYFWRAGSAALHALSVFAVMLAVPSSLSSSMQDKLPWVVWGVVIPCVVALLVVP